MAAARATWRTDPDAGVGGVAPERLVFLDECGVLTNMACLHGRAPRGQRALGTAPAGRWERVTVLGALGVDGIMAAMSVEAATDAAVFTAYLDEVLLPKLREVRPDAVLVMDNLAAHKTPAVRAALEASGFAHRYLPSYSPDLNPIEPSWAKLGQAERQAAPSRSPHGRRPAKGTRTSTRRHHAPGRPRTPQDAHGYFRHSGYIAARPTRKPL